MCVCVCLSVSCQQIALRLLRVQPQKQQQQWQQKQQRHWQHVAYKLWQHAAIPPYNSFSFVLCAATGATQVSSHFDPDAFSHDVVAVFLTGINE